MTTPIPPGHAAMREAASNLLIALQCGEGGPPDMDSRRMRDAVDALRTALSAAQRGQPVAWGAFYVDKCVNAYTTLKEARVDYPLDLATSCELRPLYAAPPPAQGAPRE